MGAWDWWHHWQRSFRSKNSLILSSTEFWLSQGIPSTNKMLSFLCAFTELLLFFSFQNASELATTCSNGINLHITLLTILGNLLLSFELDINNYYSNSILQHIITRFYCYPYGVQKEKRIWHWFRSIALIVRS